jgi:hypothetical protein
MWWKMHECHIIDDASIIDIDDAPSSAQPAKRPRYPPSASAILAQGDRNFRIPPASVIYWALICRGTCSRLMNTVMNRAVICSFRTGSLQWTLFRPFCNWHFVSAAI